MRRATPPWHAPYSTVGGSNAVAVRIASVALRAIFLINLVLGILFWTHTLVGQSATGWKLLHMALGILFVAALWLLGALQAMRGGPIRLMVGTFVLGLLLALVGFVQDETGWLQIIHVLLALSAIGTGEASAARYRRLGASMGAAPRGV